MTPGRGRDRAVERRSHQRVLPAAASRRSASHGLQHRHAVGAAARRGQERAAARLRRAGARPLPQPVRPRALVLHELRGRDPVRRAPARRGGERLQPGAVRGLHARGAVPDLPRAPGSSRSRSRSPWTGKSIADVCRAADRRTGQALLDAGADRPRAADRGRVLKEVNARLRLPARRRARLPVAGPGLGDAGRRRGAADPAGHPDRLRPGRRAVRARRAVDRAAPARQPPADRDAGPAARPRQHADRRRARRGHHPRGRLGRRHRPGRGRARRQHRRLRPAAGTAGQPRSRSPAPT